MELVHTTPYKGLATTLEMPYKDAFELPEPVQGWSSTRSEKLGASMLEAVRDVIPFLRADFPFGNGGIGDGTTSNLEPRTSNLEPRTSNLCCLTLYTHVDHARIGIFCTHPVVLIG